MRTTVVLAVLLGGCIAEQPPVGDEPEIVDAAPAPIPRPRDAGHVDALVGDAMADDALPTRAPADAGPTNNDGDAPPPWDAQAGGCPSPQVGRSRLEVRPLDLIELDGSPSEGAVSWRWLVVARPRGSIAVPVERFEDPRRPADTGIPDDPSTPGARFFVDLAGIYVFELVVAGPDGTVSPSADCERPAARVRLAAVPDGDIHIQLVWDTPSDPDQGDGEGSDMDLHLLHPRGRAWAQAPLDCYYANGSPDWGAAGREGNPSLDIDDVNGAGPENINLDDPEDTDELGHLYRVGVDYYRAENFVGGGTWGPSDATVRIYIDGEIASEQVRPMEATHHFWEAAGIVWTIDDRRVVEIDRYYESVP